MNPEEIMRQLAYNSAGDQLAAYHLAVSYTALAVREGREVDAEAFASAARWAIENQWYKPLRYD